MNMKAGVISRQIVWARSMGLEPDAKGYLASYEENLYQVMRPATKAAFLNGSGSELLDSPASPAKMRALHSSSALAVNFFDFWAGVANTPLLSALGLPDTTNAVVRFEAQYPTGLPGNPPNLDVVIELPGGDVVGIESKFTEWLTPKKGSAPAFKEKYFPAGEGVWSRAGLQQCQKLAGSVQSKDVQFTHLDASQLLKHSLGLAANLGSSFRLLYIYMDCEGPEGTLHRSEISSFADAVGSEIGFMAMSYQELFSELDAKGARGADYRNYLRARYLQAAS